MKAKQNIASSNKRLQCDTNDESMMCVCTLIINCDVEKVTLIGLNL